MTATADTGYDATTLPGVVVAYLDAHEGHRYDEAAALVADDAVVVDDGRAHTGRDAIRAWLERASTEYTYTTRRVRQRVEDAGRAEVVVHLEGDFPGGAVDLRYRFALADGRISRLTIAP